MATVEKTLSQKVDETGRAQVLFLIVCGRSSRYRVKSGVNVPSQFWNVKSQRLSIPQKIGQAIKEELKQTQERLNTSAARALKLIDIYDSFITEVKEADPQNATKRIKERIEHALTLLKDFDGTITADIVKKAEEAEKEAKDPIKNQTIFDICERYLISKSLSEQRVSMYRVTFRSMARFQVFRCSVRKRPFTWTISKVTKEDMEDFFDFMANEHIYRKKYKKILSKYTDIINAENLPKKKQKKDKYEARGNNILCNMQKRVKAIWNWLLKNGMTTNNPLLGIEMAKEKYGTPYYLNIEERKIMAAHDFSYSKHLETQRDIYLFQCHIGCRVSDLKVLTAANISKGILQYVPHKTKDEDKSFTVRVPLSKEALALIKKYKGADSKGRLFPFISDQKYNDAIKEVLRACKIERLVPIRNSKTGEIEMKHICDVASSHMGRKTFAGNTFKVAKDPNIVGRMTGHVEGSKAFARYRDIDDDMLKEVIAAVQ